MKPPSASAVVGATLAAQTVISMAALTLPVIAPTLAQVLGVDASTIGYQVSIVYAGAMASAAAGGEIVARVGACRTTQLALALVSAAMLLAMVPRLPALVAASILLGLGYGASNPAGAHLLTRFTPASSRNLIFSLKQTGVPLGGMAAALVAPIMTHALGWRAALGIVTVLATVMLTLLLPVRHHWDNDRHARMSKKEFPTAPSGRRGMLGGIGFVWARRNLRYLSLMALCFAGVQLCLMTFAVTFLVKEAHYTLVEAGVLLSMVQLAGAAGRIGWGWIADQLHASRPTLVVLGGLMFFATLAMTQINEQWSATLTTVIFMAMGVTAIGWNGVFLAEVARLAPAGETSTATGGALFFTFSGVLIGPSFFTAVYSHLESYAGTFAMAAAFVVAGLIFLAKAK
ncbi:MAG: MFS transporter [Comamonas sp.]